ncbi:MAG: MmcQ/YjbR family DNA-binding protein [Bacteroidetes bacterium]|nr:MmcQ/YjbR family DNA-binding protein [Bacteroidota bacterium]
MTIEDLQTICKKLKGVTEDIKWDDHLCFNVGEKMFLVTSPDTIPHSATFKVKDEDFDEYCSKKGFKPAPYLAKHKWVYLDDIKRLSKKQWENAIKTSYELIGSKLPVKLKKEFGLK